jgi:phosphate-selective porin
MWLGTMVLGLTLSSHAAATDTLTIQDPQAAPTPKPEKEKKEGWYRDGFELKNGKFSVGLTGYIQWDFRHFNWEPKETDLGRLLFADRELRRLRVGFEGKYKKLTFEFVVDPRTGPDAPVDLEFTDRFQLKDATVGYEFSKKAYLLVGHFKPPVSPEFLTSAAKTDFVERSLVATRLAPDRDWGVGISGEAGKFTYAAGVFAGDDSEALQSAEATGAARLTYEALKGLTVGGSFSQGKVEPEPREGSREPEPKGALGRTTTGFSFWNRAHVNGTRRRLGADLEYRRGPFRVIGEYLQEQEQRKGQGSTGQDIPDVRGSGWSLQGSWLLTGEKKVNTIAPKRSILKGGFGALEIAARVESLKFDDTGSPEGFAGYGNRARNIATSSATAIELGLNYWATNFFKLLGNAVWESYNDPLIAPIPGDTGKYFTLTARIQFMIP